MTATSINIDELMAHDAWLRRLVMDLVEPDLVEDIVQETFLAAWLAGQGQRVRNLPGFLRRVGRNLALRHRRREGRRRRREQGAAKGEALPATGQMLERLEAHRQLTAAVSQLDEPYRTTILLRYFEGLTPKQVAARQAVPASTVRTRLERGLSQLRGRLEGADVRALAALFLWPELGAAGSAAGSATATTVAAPTGAPIATKLAATLFSGAVFMSVHVKSTVLVGLLVLLAGVGIWYWDPLGVEAAAIDEDGVATRLVADVQEQPVATSDRRPLEASDLGNTETSAQATATVLRGRVLNTRGVPMANVPLLIDRKDSLVTEYDELMRVKRPKHPVMLARAETDQEGRFELPADKLTPDVEVDARLGDGFVPLWLSVPQRQDWDHKEVLVVAAPRMSIAGRVVDEDGVAIAGAIVAANVPGLVAFPFALEDVQAMPLPNTGTNARGEFALSGLPDTAELELWVLATGYRRAVVDREDDPRLIVMKRERGGDAYRIHGTVVDRSLRVVKGALVRVGNERTRSDDRGQFDLGFKRLQEDTQLFLAKKGHCTTTWDQHLEILRTGRQKEVVVVLTLGDAPRQIAGRVVDRAGEPVPGLVVVLKDTLFLGFYQTGEDLALGKKSRPESGSGNLMKVDARTGADGGFQVGGLGQRNYRLHIFDPKTLVAMITAPIAAGTADLVVRFPKDMVFAELHGVVRSSTGQPLEDVEVKCALRTFQSKVVSTWAPGDITRTDDAGRFVLERVPRAGVYLKVSGSQVMDYEVPVEAAVKGDELVLVPPLRCHFRIRGGRTDADAIRLLDAAGKVVSIFKRTGQMSMSGKEWTLRRGRTSTLAASETARTLVYLAKGKELSRQPVRLVPGKVNELQ
ncbi:MAG: RNA polymerase sigma factor [Planctomycetota bacterium]|jgi:RNA polymerase sigma-70 factor (ECF subfamily)